MPDVNHSNICFSTNSYHIIEDADAACTLLKLHLLFIDIKLEPHFSVSFIIIVIIPPQFH